MLGLFISNLNCFGHESESNGGIFGSASGTSSIVDILRDKSVNNVDNLKVKYYNNADVDPKACHNFIKYLAGESMKDSVVKISEVVTQENLGDGVSAEFASDMPDAKYLVCPHFMAEYFNNGELYEIPLIIKIEERDNESGLLTGSLVSGRYEAESGSYHLDGSIDTKHIVIDNSMNSIVSVDTIFYALSDIPDLSQISQDSKFNAFVLQCDCPAIREDAKKGDVFVFGQSKYNEERIDSSEREEVLDSWIKLFSLQDKIEAFLKADNQKVNLSIDGSNVELDAVVYMNDLFLTTSQSAVREIETLSDSTGGMNQTLIQISAEDAAHLYQYQELIVENVEGYDESGISLVEGSNLRLIVNNFDTNSGMPIIRAINGRKNNPTDQSTILPKIPGGSKLIAVDNRPSMKPSVVLPVSDMQLQIDNKKLDFKEGEVFAIVDGNVFPIEFDAIASQFDSQD